MDEHCDQMNRRRILCALVPLSGAGCLRLSGGQNDTSTEEQTRSTSKAAMTTQASTRTETEDSTDTETDLEYPPGLGPDTVYDYLPDTHVGALSLTSFTEVWKSTNVTRSHMRMHRTSHVDDGSALIQWNDGSGIEKYSTRSDQYWRQSLGNGATYGKDRGRFRFRKHSRTDKLRRFIRAGSWNPPTVDESTNTFEITADGYDDVEGLKQSWWRVEEMKSFSAEGNVNESGVITRLHVEFEFVPEHVDRVYEAHVRHRVKNIGEVTVTEPDWYETAEQRAPDVTARITDDQQFIEMRHRGGNPIVQGTANAISKRGMYDDWEWGHNDEPIEAGTTLYFWIEDGKPQWKRGSRPHYADPVTLDGQYEFKMMRNGAHYFRIKLG